MNIAKSYRVVSRLELGKRVHLTLRIHRSNRFFNDYSRLSAFPTQPLIPEEILPFSIVLRNADVNLMI